MHKKADCVGGWVRYDVKPLVEETITLPAYNSSFKRKVIEKIGNIDETLTTGSEDVEFFLRARFYGFKVISDSSMPVLHYHYAPNYKEEMKRAWNYGFRLGKTN